jgi:hypothetical protein
MKPITHAIGAVALALSLGTAPESQALLQITHQYDFEGDNGTNTFGGGITEPGWQRITIASNTTAGVPGWIAGDTHILFGGAIFRGNSTQSPTNVTRDVMIGGGQGTNTPAPFAEPTLAFRDIVPAHATNVDFTVYHSDPADTFHSRFVAYYSLNGGPTNLFYDGSANPSALFYFPPILTTLAIYPTLSDGTLDLLFFDVGFGGLGTQVRLNGIEAIYTVPEPSSLMLLLGVGFALVARRRRQ